mgnify:CR=1 FL=1
MSIAKDHIRLDYFFDPFCGWCYASAPAAKGMAEHFGEQLHMQPSGLFANERPVSSIVNHAYKTDIRIGQLTGQVFSEAYHQEVMRAPDGVFSSMPSTLALVALGELDTALEPQFLHQVQIARYVHGRDTSRVEEVVAVARTVAGSGLDVAVLGERLRTDEGLFRKTNERIARTQAMMQTLQLSGVPLLLMTRGIDRKLIQGQDLYAGADHLVGLLNELART